MKITNISNLFNVSKNTNNTQNFKGLWGKTSLKTDIDNVLYVPQIVETKYYFPFVDEDPKNVKKIIADRQSAQIVNENGCDKYKISDCKLGAKFPFSELQYDAYRNLPKDFKYDNMIKRIHLKVRDKYITENYGRRQVSASNPYVEARVARDPKKPFSYYV